MKIDEPQGRTAPAARERAESANVTAARADERRRVGRDLHDGAQQALLAIAIGLDLAADRAVADPDLHRRLVELRSYVDHALDAVSGIARGLDPPLLAEHGLEQSLAGVVGRIPVSAELVCHDVGRYPTEVETAVYFSCVEALQNALKHAGASKIAVDLLERRGMLRLHVRDDGCGFDPRRRLRGRGLASIAGRMTDVGGRLQIRSAPGAGTTVSAAVSVAAVARPPDPSRQRKPARTFAGRSASTVSTGTE